MPPPRGGLRRDRRGRGPRGPLAWPAVPAMVTRAERFDDVVLEAMGRLEALWDKPLPTIQLAVEEVPPSDPAPWEHRQVPLGRMFPATATAPYQVVVYRRPLTTRCRDEAEVVALVLSVLTEQVAGVLGVTPEQLDPGYDDVG